MEEIDNKTVMDDEIHALFSCNKCESTFENNLDIKITENQNEIFKFLVTPKNYRKEIKMFQETMEKMFPLEDSS